ncbi:nucleotidyltransferase domain-containing protein [Microbacterium sp. NPDC055903]
MDDAELSRLYGPWAARRPEHLAEVLADYPGPWWIAGGWAIQAFTGVERAHADIDPSVPRRHAGTLRAHLAGVFDVWAADRGTLTPLIEATTSPSPTCSNLWLRRDGRSPWEFDVILMDTDEDMWTYKRDPRIRLPFADILWESEGLLWLRPEIQLLHKAPGMRPKDQKDFDDTVPMLEPRYREWLSSALQTAHPGHPWIARLGD